MKNILISFFKVSGLTMITGLFSFLMLLVLFNDQVHGNTWLIILLAAFLGGLTVFVSFLVVYLPIFYLNKYLFEKASTKNLFDRFLPLALIPLTLICGSFMISNPNDFFDGDVLVFILTGYIITSFSFYQFIRLMKEQYDNRNQLY